MLGCGFGAQSLLVADAAVRWKAVPVHLIIEEEGVRLLADVNHSLPVRVAEQCACWVVREVDYHSARVRPHQALQLTHLDGENGKQDSFKHQAQLTGSDSSYKMLNP